MKHVCPRRAELFQQSQKPGTDPQDKYLSRRGLVNQPKGCSYCGSLPPDMFMQLVRSGEGHPEGTDKSYKFYIHWEDPKTKVSIDAKFYTAHLSHDQAWEFRELWNADKIKWSHAPYVPIYLPGVLDRINAESAGNTEG